MAISSENRLGLIPIGFLPFEVVSSSNMGVRRVIVETLGSFDVRVGKSSAVPTAKKPRMALALLLLNEGRVVPAASLIEELWGEQPPRSAMTTLQTYVLQLRKAFARALKVSVTEVGQRVLVNRHGGYVLHLDPAEYDLREFKHLAAAGNSALRRGDLDEAVRLLRRALDLWSGPALADVEHGRLIAAEVVGLEQSWVTALETLYCAELDRGRHREVLGDLACLATKHPFHEQLHALHILALCRSGQRHYALEAYRRMRAAMQRELGIDPCQMLQRLQQAVLEGDPWLYGTTSVRALLNHYSGARRSPGDGARGRHVPAEGPGIPVQGRVSVQLNGACS